MIDDAYRQLMKHAHRLAMDGHSELAQYLRLTLNDAARYWHLRDKSSPEECRFFLATNESRAMNFKDPAFIDKQVDTDRANMEAREHATKA